MSNKVVLKAYKAINAVADNLRKRGIFLPDAYKRRDPREPNREEKEFFEDALAKQFDLYFAGQEERLEQYLRATHLARKAALPEDIFRDEEIEAAILVIIIAMAQAGIALFDSQIEIGFALAVYNTLAVDWARKHAGLLIKNINANTLKAVQKAIATFIETPGMTIGQLIELLPFGETRSRLIAITETTNAFAQAELIAAEQLQKEFPDVTIVRTWFTNNDPNVCIICQGLDGKKIKLGEVFVSRTTGGEYLTAGAPPTGPHIGDRCWVTHRTEIV